MSEEINQYANSMFRFESLHEQWLDACTRYCQTLFGAELKDRTVLDYAFGRGNWSIALLRAGAKRVFAVDASRDNVARFESYLKREGLSGSIVPIHGNLVSEDLGIKADLLWLYGILHHIPDLAAFLRRLSSVRSSPSAWVYGYFYPALTPRDFTVTLARSLYTYANEADFRKDEPAFNRPARVRARDDLVAPYVKFLTADQFRQELSQAGIEVVRQDRDFFQFQNGMQNQEFIPHQLLGSWETSASPVTVSDPLRVGQTDWEILLELGELVRAAYPTQSERRSISIGLFNTHFSASGYYSSTDSLLFELSLYLGNLLMIKGQKTGKSDLTSDFLSALAAALLGKSKVAADAYKCHTASKLFAHLTRGSVRL